MARRQRPVETLAPGQRVAVFLNDAASGDILGYHRRILSVSLESIKRNLHREDRWVYRVEVPALQAEIDVEACRLVVFADPNDSEAAPPLIPLGVLRFESPPANDNPEIKGFFRILDDEWTYFHFTKTALEHRNYELSVPVLGNKVGVGILRYEVPNTERLDLGYVIQALAEIMGGGISWSIAKGSSSG